MARTVKNLLAVVIGLTATLLTYAIHAIVVRPPHRAGAEYPITGWQAANHGWATAGVLVLVGGAIGYTLRSAVWAPAAGLLVVYVAGTCYEISRFPTSHNLLPFELIVMVVYASPLLLGSFIGRRLAEKRGSRAA